MHGLVYEGKVSPRWAAFTLIELLVVVAILAILAALLLPALGKTREQGKRAVCMGHLKRVSLATFLMADDNNGWINGTGSPTVQADVTNYWVNAITNYLGRSDKLINYGCPNKRSNPGSIDIYNSYAANTAFVWRDFPDVSPMHPIYGLRRPVRVWLVGECYFWYPWAPGHIDIANLGNAGSYPEIPARHRGEGLNFVFVDGHGEFLKATGYNGGLLGKWWDYTGEPCSWPGIVWYDIWCDP